MGFNKRKLEDQRRHAAEKEAAARRALDPQIIADAERLIEHWNERQAKRLPMLFSPTIGPPSRAGIGSSGYAARLAAPRMRLICARSIGITMPR